MAYSAYDGYDVYNRPRSRRGSMAYGAPFSHQGVFSEPQAMSVGDYPQPSYQIYGPPPTNAVVPLNHRLTGPPYDDLDMHDPYYPDERQMSMASSHMGAMTPMIRPRQRRHSAVSFTTTRPPPVDMFRRPSSTHIKFKRKGTFTAGISLDEAQSHVRLSGHDTYSMHDLHADSRGRVHLRVRWTGYSSLTYEIPLDGYSDGRINLQTLARRVSRACVHYLQANVIPIVWNRVQLHHLEEVSYGVWQPMLSAR